jgi:hypothetical protein
VVNAIAAQLVAAAEINWSDILQRAFAVFLEIRRRPL